MYRQISLIFLVGVMVFGVGLASVAAPVSAQQAASVDAPTWSLGDHWTWQWGKGQETDTVVGATDGYAMRLEITGADTKVVHYNADFSSPDVHFNEFQFPMTVGRT